MFVQFYDAAYENGEYIATGNGWYNPAPIIVNGKDPGNIS